MLFLFQVGAVSLSALGTFYADPGSGTLIWQLLAAAGFGLLFYARVIIRKIRAVIGTRDKADDKDLDSRAS